jgi:hypothetical protein
VAAAWERLEKGCGGDGAFLRRGVIHRDSQSAGDGLRTSCQMSHHWPFIRSSFRQPSILTVVDRKQTSTGINFGASNLLYYKECLLDPQIHGSLYLLHTCSPFNGGSYVAEAASSFWFTLCFSLKFSRTVHTYKRFTHTQQVAS